MADDTSKAGPGDRARINLRQRHEVRYWTGALECTEGELQAAVERVGVMATDVRRYLTEQKKRP